MEERAAEQFDIGSLPEMCETAMVIADELAMNEQLRQQIIVSCAAPIVEAIYAELAVHDNFAELPLEEEMIDELTKALVVLLPELTKRVFQRVLKVPRDTGEEGV